MPVFKLEAEDGTWFSDIRVGVPNWKPGDRIPRCRDTLEVVRVRHDDERDVLVVRPVQGPKERLPPHRKVPGSRGAATDRPGSLAYF